MIELKAETGMAVLVETIDHVTGKTEYGIIELEKDGENKFKSKTDKWKSITEEEAEALKND